MAAALGWRRLIIAVVIVLLLPGALALTVLSEKRPGPPPAVTGPSFDPLPNVPVGPVRSELDRNRTVSRLTEKLTAPTLLDATASGSNDPDALPTLAITPRVEPYSLAELRDVVPDAFSDVTGVAPVGTLLLKARLQVPLGATLVIDGRTPDVRLASTPAGFATIISRGTLIVAGDVTHPVRISSWDPAPGRPDEDLTDGRPFIMQIGGRMDASHAVFEYLGFNVGISSGVTWNGAPASTPHSAPVKAQGTVTGSVFRHNYVGAYTREAEGMRWVGNTFAFNLEYGYDPHDFSDNFDVAGNVAYHNGKHGFIFSRGCTNNILRGNVSYGNAGHGFMIDDGRSTSLSRSEDRVDGSNNNVLENNDAFGNGGSGIEIEGGTQNSVVGNGLTGNYVGVRIKDGASATVRDNTIADNLKFGVDVLDGAGSVLITGNTISGSWGAVNLASASGAVVDANSVTDVSAPMVVAGNAFREDSWTDDVAVFLRWNPLLLLWSLVLGVPIVVVTVRFVVRPFRFRRRRIPVG